MRPMISHYGPGAFFTKHADNYCDRGRGSLCNDRLLTAIFYCTQTWRPEHGRQLRIYAPEVGDTAAGGESANVVISKIPPEPGRLVLFLSDLRCPHEVLPVLQGQRFAVTLWYTSTSTEADDSMAALWRECFSAPLHSVLCQAWTRVAVAVWAGHAGILGAKSP